MTEKGQSGIIIKMEKRQVPEDTLEVIYEHKRFQLSTEEGKNEQSERR